VARRSRGFQRTGARRRSGWENGPVIDLQVTSSGQVISTGIVALSDGITLVRSRGLITLQLLVATAAAAGFSGAFGLAIVTTDAFDASAVPDPVTEAGWDGWVWHSYFHLKAPLAGVVNNAGLLEREIVIDSKAMRKWRENETLFLASEHTITGTATMSVEADIRFLAKLP